MLPLRSTRSPLRPDRGSQTIEPIDTAWIEQRALRYASNWETSEAAVGALLERKIRERCEQLNESPDAALDEIPAVIAKLVERDYVNDQRFAETTLKRQRDQGASTARIQEKLASKGISDSITESVFSGESPDAELRAAWRLARRRRLGPYCRKPRNSSGSDELGQLPDRQLAILARAGFDYETAQQITRAEAPPESE